MSLRAGVDVGGTFTKAVAVAVPPVELRAHAVVPTTHSAPGGVAEGVAHALRGLLGELGDDAERVELVAFSTTQAMNALLEGDVPLVGVIGMGAEPELRVARRRTRVGSIALAAGRELRTEHAFLDVTGGLDAGAVDRALDALEAAGCRAIAVSGAFAVDRPDEELAVAQRARARGLPACAGHELTGAYGLETRTVSAAVNASILPAVERTAAIVDGALREAGSDVPLLVLRGDGGAMPLDAFRRTPSLTIGSGPAAGVAAALQMLGLRDGIVLECGGTSSNVSVVRGGRTVLRTLRVMGRPTALRSVDSWVVGAAGGSMPRLGRRRRIAEVGPRSAHVAGLPYASFADPSELDSAQVIAIAPRPGDPEAYAALQAAGGRYAITATCAANALGGVEERAYAAGSQASALRAFAALGAALRCTPALAAQRVLDGAVAKIADAVADAARCHDLGPEVPVVALGGAGAALAPAVARALGRPLLTPDHPEVLSSIGAALSLVRAEVVRHAARGSASAVELAREAERACVEAGAAPATVTVETRFEAEDGVIRAVATGAVALESGAATRPAADAEERRAAAAGTLGVPAGELELVCELPYYAVYATPGGRRVAVVDPHGAVALAEDARRVLCGSGDALLGELADAVREASVNLGVAAVLPRVALVCGARLLDMSDARRPEEIVDAAGAALHDEDGPAVAVLSR